MVALPEGAMVAYNVYLSATITFGVPGNILVLLIYLKSGAVTSADWFIIFISIYDLISSLISVPIYLTFSSDTWIYYGNDVICKLHRFISQSAVLSSTFLICGLAIERYYKVCRPKSTIFTSAKSKRTCMAISAVATVFSLPCLILFQNRQMHCGSVTEGVLVNVLMAYYTGMLLSYLSAVVILIYTYSRIAVTILKSQLNLLDHKHNTSGGQRPNRKYRICAFLAICCRENKIYPYDSHHFSRTRRDSERACAVDEVSEDKTSVCLNRIESAHNTDDNDNETEVINDVIEMNNLSRDHDRVIEAGVIISYRKLRSNRGEMPPVGEYLELPDRRSQRIHRIKVIKLRDSEFNGSHTASESYTEQRTECTDVPTECPDTKPKQSVPKSVSQIGNNEILKTVKSMNEIRRLRGSLKTTRIVFLICLIFVLSWIPPWASFITFVFMSPTTKMSATYLMVNMFFRMTYLINTFSNPILYTALNKKFRDKLKKFICRT